MLIKDEIVRYLKAIRSESKDSLRRKGYLGWHHVNPESICETAIELLEQRHLISHSSRAAGACADWACGSRVKLPPA